MLKDRSVSTANDQKRKKKKKSVIYAHLNCLRDLNQDKENNRIQSGIHFKTIYSTTPSQTVMGTLLYITYTVQMKKKLEIPEQYCLSYITTGSLLLSTMVYQRSMKRFAQ